MTARQATGGDSTLPSPEVRILLFGLALAATAELIILRTFTRTAIHIPAFELLGGPYRVIADAGRYTYFMSVVLLIVALPVVVRANWKQAKGAGRATAGGLALLAVALAAAAVGAGSDFQLNVVSLAVVTLLAGAAAIGAKPRAALPVVLFGLAFLFSATHTTLQLAAQEGVVQLDARWLLSFAEILGVGFALSSPLLVKGRASRGASLVSALVGLAVFGMLLSEGSTLRILLLWNGGLAGTLPSTVYAGAAAALTFTVVTLLQRGDRVMVAGFVLLLAGGIGLHNTYQTGLTAMGLAVLCLAFATPERHTVDELPAR